MNFSLESGDYLFILGENGAGKSTLMKTILRLIKPISGQVRFDEPMSTHTSFHIGGPADALVIPVNLQDIRKILRIAREEQTPLTVIGNGSNLLVRDKGIRGIVLKLGNALKHWEQDGTVEHGLQDSRLP